MNACDSLVRLACTPSSGQLLSIDDRDILIWAYTVRSAALLNLGRTDNAIADLSDAIELDPISAPLLTNRCRVRAAANYELDLALADCNAAIDSEPNAAYAFDSRGLVRLRRGEFTEALSDYDTALHAQPGVATALYGRAIARARLGQVEASQMDAAEAVGNDDQIDDWFAAIGLMLQ